MEKRSIIMPEGSAPEGSAPEGSAPEGSAPGDLLPKAGIFRRASAFFIDHLILLVTFLFVFNNYFDFFLYKIIFSSRQFALLVTIIIFIVELYFVLFEWLWKGKTPGKFLTGIFVVNEGKKDLDLYSLIIRNLLRCTYFTPPFFLLPDLICIIMSRRSKRLGDFFAGTVCVVKRKAESGRHL